ncbi:MAG TPA: uL15m family ribosomal protein [Methanomassiliicoccales archaeon]|nr:uL15m family ribosomal protein [Methanomassiliicoccales archaeon]
MPSRTKKLRGSRTHGRGKKAGRGAGKRGGRGNAGLWKHKKMSIYKYNPEHFGRRGFKRPQKVVSAKITMNVGYLEENLESLKRDGFATEESGMTMIDLTKLGIDKLLGFGRVETPLQIVVPETSERARNKVEEAGGTILEPQ